MPAAADTYRFGPFELRTGTRELFKHGTRLKLRPQPFQVLQVLVERAGGAVTREELQQKLWPGETFVDFAHGLNTSIRELRRALSDSASAPRYIETLPKLGYRMIVAVEAVETAPVETAARDRPPAEEPVPPVRSMRRVVALGVVLATLGLSVAFFARTRRSNGSRFEITRIAKLTSDGKSVKAAISPDGR